MARVARATEVIAGSPVSFDDAVKVGFERARKTLRGITGMRILEQRIKVADNEMVEYRIRLEIIFLREDSTSFVFSRTIDHAAQYTKKIGHQQDAAQNR